MEFNIIYTKSASLKFEWGMLYVAWVRNEDVGVVYEDQDVERVKRPMIFENESILVVLDSLVSLSNLFIRLDVNFVNLVASRIVEFSELISGHLDLGEVISDEHIGSYLESEYSVKVSEKLPRLESNSLFFCTRDLIQGKQQLIDSCVSLSDLTYSEIARNVI